MLTIDVARGAQGISPLFFNKSPSNSTIGIMMQVFDQLVELRSGSIEPKADLARSWKISEDGLTYRFNLRTAKFSNGDPVTSGDVKFSLTAASKSAFANLFSAIKSIETPDAKTVILHLSKPSPSLIYTLAFPGASIMPKSVIANQGRKSFNRSPIGSGPYMVKSWSPNQDAVLKRNPRYWRTGKPYLDEIKIKVVPDDNTRVLDVKSGTADVADSVPFSQIKNIDKSGKADMLIGPGADMYVIGINNSSKPFDDVNVRRALALATPVDEILKVVFANRAPAMNSITPKLKYWSSNVDRVPFDLKKAQASLAKSSVPSGFETSIMINAGDQASSQTAQILKQAYAKIGVNLRIKPLDNATATQRYQTGNYELHITPPGQFTSDIPVDDEFATLLYASPQINNLFSFFHDAKLKKMTQEAVREVDPKRRKQLFEAIQKRSMSLLPFIPIAYTPNRAAVGDSVDGFNYLLNGWWRLEDVWKRQ